MVTTQCAGGLQKGGTKVVPCTNGFGGGPAEGRFRRDADGQLVCAKHRAGARAIRVGGAFNDNGKPQYIYLRRDLGASRLKVGRSHDPSSRDLPGVPIASFLVPVRELGAGIEAPVAECIEHSVRLRFTQAIRGQLRPPGKEWTYVDGPIRDDEARAAFDEAGRQVKAFYGVAAA